MLDFHSHSDSRAIVSLTPSQYSALKPDAKGLFTVGIHPWDTASATEDDLATIEKAMADKRIVAIGETGIDTLRGASLDRQNELFESQLAIAARHQMPVVIHVVKRYDTIAALHRRFGQTPWAIHGFRGKPSVARQLTDRGIYLSLGARFNPETARVIPENLLLAETDDDQSADIDAIITDIARARGTDQETLKAKIAENIDRFCGFKRPNPENDGAR